MPVARREAAAQEEGLEVVGSTVGVADLEGACWVEVRRVVMAVASRAVETVEAATVEAVAM